TQQAVKPDLSRRRQQQVRAAHDMRDALGGIIHDHGELVGEWPVGTADDEIADIAREILADMALQAILEAEQTVFRDTHAQGASALSRRQSMPAGAGIDRPFLAVAEGI